MLALNRWGPSGWHFLHTVMMTAPETLDHQQRADMRSFLVSVGLHLPCPKCRRHFSSFVAREATDDRLATRSRLVELMNDCHNDVNRRTQKPEFTLRQHYEWMASGKAHRRPWPDAPVYLTVLVAAYLVCRIIGEKMHTKGQGTLGALARRR